MRNYIDLIVNPDTPETIVENELLSAPILIEGVESPLIPSPKRMDMMRMLASCTTVRGIVLYLKDITLFAIADGSTWTHNSMLSAIANSGIELNWQYHQNSREMYIFSLPAATVLQENDWTVGYYHTSKEGVGILSSGPNLDSKVEEMFPDTTAHGEMDEIEVELTEAPITDFTHVGDWEKNSSYTAQDRKLLTNPKALTKIKAMWKYPEEVDYNIILVNNAEARNWTEVGAVTDERLKQMFPKTYDELKKTIRGDQVNIIYTNNKGDQRVPMTGWIMAHRLGHVMDRGKDSFFFKEATLVLDRYISDLMDDYGLRRNSIDWSKHKALMSTTSRTLLQDICTFKSARDKKLRNSYEAVHELFAQYIVTGSVRFNDLPRSVKFGPSSYHFRDYDENYDYVNRAIQHDLPYELVSYFETAIHKAVGQIWVM